MNIPWMHFDGKIIHDSQETNQLFLKLQTNPTPGPTWWKAPKWPTSNIYLNLTIELPRCNKADNYQTELNGIPFSKVEETLPGFHAKQFSNGRHFSSREETTNEYQVNLRQLHCDDHIIGAHTHAHTHTHTQAHTYRWEEWCAGLPDERKIMRSVARWEKKLPVK